MKSWVQRVKTTSVSEGPPGTMGADKEPWEMAEVLLRVNPTKSKLSIIRYMQYVINRAGRKMKAEHQAKIKEAMEIIKMSDHDLWRQQPGGTDE